MRFLTICRQLTPHIIVSIKTRTMKTVRKHPFLSAVFFLLFLQVPVFISGVAGSNHKTLKLPVHTVAVSEEKSLDEKIMAEADSIYEHMDLSETGLASQAFQLAFKGYNKLMQKGLVNLSKILTIVDFSKSSSEKRLFVIDMEEQKVLFQTLVAHGRNSGLRFATNFSNKPESNKSSLGFYLTLDTYYGGNGYSLKLRGLEKGINDKAYDRAIVVHGSDYVNATFAGSNGFLGRSFGCPAVPRKYAAPIINTIKNGSVLFIYHPSKNYVNQSTILNS
jgi:hypothetical protein